MSPKSIAYVVALSAFGFVASVVVGTVYASCNTECDEFDCWSLTEEISPDPGNWDLDKWPCMLSLPKICDTWSPGTMRDAMGGTCEFNAGMTQRQKCPDCNPECFTDPSEATGCPAMTPGCPPGQCCEAHDQLDFEYWCEQESL